MFTLSYGVQLQLFLENGCLQLCLEGIDREHAIKQVIYSIAYWINTTQQ